MKNLYNAVVVNDGRRVQVYRLKTGTPTPSHVWCDFKDCKTTFTEKELKDVKEEEEV